MDKVNLVDIYRNLHPSIKSFTYESKPLNLKSRIDFILVSRPIAVDAKSAQIRPSVAPDHKATFLSFNIRSELRRGSGTRKFNNSLLKDDKFKELREAPFENHAVESTVHLSDFPLIWHTCTPSQVYITCATVWLKCLLFRRTVNQTVRQSNGAKLEVKYTPYLITSYKQHITRNEMTMLPTRVVTLNKGKV